MNAFRITGREECIADGVTAVKKKKFSIFYIGHARLLQKGNAAGDALKILMKHKWTGKDADLRELGALYL